MGKLGALWAKRVLRPKDGSWDKSVFMLLLLILFFVSSCDGRRRGAGGRRRSYSSGGGGWPAEGLDSLGVGLICMIVAIAFFVLCFNCFYYGCCDALHNSDFGSPPKSSRDVGKRLTSGEKS